MFMNVAITDDVRKGLAGTVSRVTMYFYFADEEVNMRLRLDRFDIKTAANIYKIQFV